MSTERYLDSLPERVRVKIGLAPDLTPKAEMTWRDICLYGIRDAVEEAVRRGQKNVESLQRFGREYPTAVPEPAVAELSKDELTGLASLLASRGLNIFNENVVIRVGDLKFTLSVEFECG